MITVKELIKKLKTVEENGYGDLKVLALFYDKTINDFDHQPISGVSSIAIIENGTKYLELY